MMEKEKLRKADIFSGSAIFAVGLWIIAQSLKMPMKDSWGGVQNVWFVSPAIFPLLVGAVITLLGAALVRIALKRVGWQGLAHTLRWLASSELYAFLKTAANVRFVAIVVLLVSLVYLNIPRIDFFLCSVLFLMAFITMFYFDDDRRLPRMLRFYCLGTLGMAGFFAFGLQALLDSRVPFSGDWLTLVFILAYGFYCWRLSRPVQALKKKFRTSLVLSVCAPLIVGSIFKYLLLVPMPTEGLVVLVMDAIRYWDF